MELTSKQRRILRALAHHLKPVVQVGTGGLTEAVLAKAEAEIDYHELIKVKVSKDSPTPTSDASVQLSTALRAGVAQIIGRTVILYRPRKKRPSIRLPAE